ncbi:hypothetical protein GQ53DRAFT_870612 [Thozetella sp. PMI_491]|nr:hypothetical protein GQ53DRAFT_870612 [Thozetella sp. PMI_491]
MFGRPSQAWSCLFLALVALILVVRLGPWNVSLEIRGSDSSCRACQNATLGLSNIHLLTHLLQFEKIVAVSAGASWRTDGLYEAADRTGLEIITPFQPEWTDPEVDSFRKVGVEDHKFQMGPGQARCWLGHLNAFREIIANGWSTALVMEDDNDWDIMIKEQMSLVAPMIRQLSNDSNLGSRSPYGDSWDLLWLGHCGDVKPTAGSDPLVSRMDETLPDSPLYRQMYGDYTYYPPQLRLAHWTIRPGCTYAYAITSAAAQAIYQTGQEGMNEIVTVELRWWCTKGGLKCITVTPELFHHHKKAGEVASEIAVLEGWSELAAPPKVGYTANIKYSARCNSQSKTLVSCQQE